MASADDPRPGSTPAHYRGCPALVVAGGRSRRFGSDKLEAVVGGSTVLDRALAAVRAVTDDITVLGRRHPELRSLPDPEPRRGPLSAIGHALATSSVADAAEHHRPAEVVLVVGGDHPLLVPELLALVIDSVGGRDAAVPLDRGGRPQPLVAAYRSSLGPSMRAAVDDGVYGLIRFLETVDVEWVEPIRWESADPGGRSFTDVDTVRDLGEVSSALEDTTG